MIRGINPNERIEFTSKYDEDEPKTIFVIKPLTVEERNNIQEDNGIVRLAGTKIIDFLALSIVEIKNMDGGGTVRDKLNLIKDDKIILELIENAGKLNNMTRQDQKN